MAAGALVAPKVFVAQALAAKPGPGAFTLDGVRFVRAWLQVKPRCADVALQRGPDATATRRACWLLRRQTAPRRSWTTAPVRNGCLRTKQRVKEALTWQRRAGVLLLRLPADARAALLASGGAAPAVGRAVLVVGRLGAADASPGTRRALKVSKLVQLDGGAGGAQREALWALEVAELWRSTLKLLPPAADGAAPASA
jgi:hypothetical protein